MFDIIHHSIFHWPYIYRLYCLGISILYILYSLAFHHLFFNYSKPNTPQ
nr:MAG TPA: hypothetical protein [Caudoviricetes sp.]